MPQHTKSDEQLGGRLDGRGGHRAGRGGRGGRLVLADGSIFRGRAFGAAGVTTAAEVVFNTAMTGYQESLTDPSYRGQVLVETFPMIGIVGVNDVDEESARVQVSGLVVHELARLASNYRSTGSLSDYLSAYGVMGLAGVDTRALTRRIRSSGAMAGVLSDDASLSDAELLALARSAGSMAGQNLVPSVGRSEEGRWEQSLGEWGGEWGGGSEGAHAAGKSCRVLAFDCGAKNNILRHLVSRGCEVVVVPHDVGAADILGRFERGEIDGVFVSNGPGDPSAVEATIETLRAIVKHPTRVPIFGICLGHQLLALAVGAKTYKLAFGHRGTNQPVLECASVIGGMGEEGGGVGGKGGGRVAITSQNHGFAVEAESLEAAGGRVTHRHLNDQTVAGFELLDQPVFGVQFHPEASPGPHDGAGLFDRFVEAMLVGCGGRGGRG